MTRALTVMSTLAAASAFAACTGSNDTRKSTASAGAAPVASIPAQAVPPGTHDYGFRGKITEIAADRRSVTLDHEEIAGFMPAMKMSYTVPDAAVLADLAVGDLVQGRMHVKADYTILSLTKR